MYLLLTLLVLYLSGGVFAFFASLAAGYIIRRIRETYQDDWELCKLWDDISPILGWLSYNTPNALVVALFWPVAVLDILVTLAYRMSAKIWNFLGIPKIASGIVDPMIKMFMETFYTKEK